MTDKLNKSQQFDPIPHWISLYGFFGVALLFILTMLFSYLFRMRSIVNVDISIKNDSIYANCNLKQFELLKTHTQLDLRIFIDNKVVKGILRPQKKIIRRDTVSIPIVVDSNELSFLPIPEGTRCLGEVTFDERSLLSKIFTKHKLK